MSEQGDLKKQGDINKNLLNLCFSHRHVTPLQQVSKPHLLAVFISNYLHSNFLCYTPVCNTSAPIHINSQQAVHYIVNELIENAIKFQELTLFHPIEISLYHEQNMLIFKVKNITTAENMKKFHYFMNKVHSSPDLYQLYIESMEYQAHDISPRYGLGLLSIMCDYAAKIEWVFDSMQPISNHTLVTTIVSVKI